MSISLSIPAERVLFASRAPTVAIPFIALPRYAAARICGEFRFASPAVWALLALIAAGGLHAAFGRTAQEDATATVKQVEERVGVDDTAKAAPMIVEGVQGGNVYEFNRTIEINGRVHGVMVVGGDCVVRGRVEGDVATIGGSVFQTEGSFIGGDVIVLGGAYHHGKAAPGRNPASTTVMVAGLEEELREFARTPSSLLAPRFTPDYIGGRLLAVLFWFITSLALTAFTPNAVSRAGARLRLTSVRVALIGFVSLVVLLCGVPVSLRFLPAPLAAFVGVLTLLFVTLAYVFGRVVLHAVIGRMLQRRFFPGRRESESLALLLGVFFWVLLLSLPYVWTLVVGALLVVSLGLGLTARTPLDWRRASAASPLRPGGEL